MSSKWPSRAYTLMLFYNLDPDVVTGIIRGFGYGPAGRLC
jgi:hypothetical protein